MKTIPGMPALGAASTAARAQSVAFTLGDGPAWIEAPGRRGL